MVAFCLHQNDPDVLGNIGEVGINFSNGIFIQGVALVRLVQRDNSDVVQLGGEQERGGHKKLLVLRKCEGSGANQLGSV
jgi:hypothetical protein